MFNNLKQSWPKALLAFLITIPLCAIPYNLTYHIFSYTFEGKNTQELNALYSLIYENTVSMKELSENSLLINAYNGTTVCIIDAKIMKIVPHDDYMVVLVGTRWCKVEDYFGFVLPYDIETVKLKEGNTITLTGSLSGYIIRDPEIISKR